MECTLCKGQYTGKSETAFSNSLNNHRKDVYKANTPGVDQNFKLHVYNFNWQTNFTKTEQVNNTELDKELLTFRLKTPDDFCIHHLKTLKPQWFDAELNFSNPWNFCIFRTILLRRSYEVQYFLKRPETSWENPAFLLAEYLRWSLERDISWYVLYLDISLSRLHRRCCKGLRSLDKKSFLKVT